MVSDEDCPEATCNDARECKITEREYDDPKACRKTTKEVSSSHLNVIYPEKVMKRCCQGKGKCHGTMRDNAS